jgi:spore maturation protein CgeB
MGHEFVVYDGSQSIEDFFYHACPQIVMTGLSHYLLKHIDIEVFYRLKQKYKTKVFVSIPFWKSPLSKLRFNETPSLSQSPELVDIIRSGKYGDFYYNVCPQGDPRMQGFTETTGKSYQTVLLAADKTIMYPRAHAHEYASDISFVGTCLPEKRRTFEEWVYPLKKDYTVKLYGQDWTLKDRLIGFAAKVGQYYRMPGLRSIQKPSLTLDNEAEIYSSSHICINIHEEYQKKFGLDCNERTFKIGACRGFQIVDDVECIKKYFTEDKEIVIARNKNDFWEKIQYYIAHPEARMKIADGAYKRVLQYHTYHHRVKQFIDIYSKL